MAKNELATRDEGAAANRRSPGAGTYIRPWVTTVAMVPAGWAAHLMWGDAGWATGLATAAVAAAGGILTLYTHWLTRARTWYAHAIATASTGTTTAWLAAATVAGTGRPLLDIGLLVGSGLAVFSNIHTWGATQGSLESEAAPQFDWESAAAKVGLRGTRMRVKEATDTRVSGTVTMAEGQTADELTSKLKKLASVFGVGANAVRAVENPNNTREAEVTILRTDLMRELVPWPGLNTDHIGASLEDAPLELGIYEDGQTFTDTLNNRHSLTMGMAGSGKSVYAKCKLVQTAARRDAFVVAVDLAKGKQTLGPVEDAIGWPLLRTSATNQAKKEARQVFAALKRAIGARADYLGEQGLTQWTQGCGLTFLYVLFEEAAQLVDFDEVVDIAQVARSTGIHLNLSLQRASWGNIDTDARAEIGDGVCFGVKYGSDAGFCLPEHTIDAGAAPEQWQKSRPGAAYAAIEEQPQERHAVPIKMYGPPSTDVQRENELLAAAAAQVGDQDAKLDTVTREAFGKPYADYLASHGQAAPAVVTIPDTEEAPARVEVVERGQEDEDDMEEFEFTTPDPDPDVQSEIDDPIEITGTDFQIPAKKRSRESAEEARSALDALLSQWAEQGRQTFRAPDVGRALRETGVDRSRAWVSGELNRLAEEESPRVIHEDDGTWTLVAGTLATA